MRGDTMTGCLWEKGVISSDWVFLCSSQRLQLEFVWSCVSHHWSSQKKLVHIDLLKFQLIVKPCRSLIKALIKGRCARPGWDWTKAGQCSSGTKVGKYWSRKKHSYIFVRCFKDLKKILLKTQNIFARDKLRLQKDKMVCSCVFIFLTEHTFCLEIQNLFSCVDIIEQLQKGVHKIS